MKCDQVEPDLTDLARNRPMDAAAERRVLEHVETCGECAERLASQRELTAALRGLAAEASAAGAPGYLEGTLRGSFRQRRSGRGRRYAWIAGAVAAGAVAASVLAIFALRGPEVAPERPPLPPPPKVVVSVAKPEEPQPTARPPRRRRAARPAVAAREVTTPFLALRDFDPNEPTIVVRVKLPRASLAVFGLPMNEDRDMDRVKADVVLGEDGLARAVRFVH